MTNNEKIKLSQNIAIIAGIFCSMLSLLCPDLYAQPRKKFTREVQDYQGTVKLLNIKNADGKIVNAEIDTNTFNMNKYLSFFNKLKFPKNVIPQYIYGDFSTFGYPFLYIAKDSSKITEFHDKKIMEYFPRTDSVVVLSEEFKSFFKKEALIGFAADSINKLCYNVTPENSKSGFLQYLFLNTHGEGFALKWHANAGLSYVITSKTEIKQYFEKFYKEVFDLNQGGIDSLMNVKPKIKIKMKKDECLITWDEFAPFQAGYNRYIYSIERFAPYRIKLVNQKRLIDFESTIIF